MGTPEERWVYEFGSYRLDTAAQLLCSATVAGTSILAADALSGSGGVDNVLTVCSA